MNTYIVQWYARNIKTEWAMQKAAAYMRLLLIKEGTIKAPETGPEITDDNSRTENNPC